ncbi:MAG: hypothetical protein WC668_01035 [Patescibacteria group bacterium]|jgi:hypothetical protein
MFNIVKFFTPGYFLELRPYTYPSTIKIMIGAGIILLLIAVALKVYASRKKMPGYRLRLFDQIAAWFATFGGLELFWTWLRYERVSYLSARFWSVILLLAALWWAYRIFLYWRKAVPQAQKQAETHQQYLKYLPQKK